MFSPQQWTLIKTEEALGAWFPPVWAPLPAAAYVFWVDRLGGQKHSWALRLRGEVQASAVIPVDAKVRLQYATHPGEPSPRLPDQHCLQLALGL